MEFVAYLEKRINFIKNEEELKEMRSLFETMFKRFDEGKSINLNIQGVRPILSCFVFKLINQYKNSYTSYTLI